MGDSAESIAGSFERLAASIAEFEAAVEYATWEWPDVVLEDILDADLIG